MGADAAGDEFAAAHGAGHGVPAAQDLGPVTGCGGGPVGLRVTGGELHGIEAELSAAGELTPVVAATAALADSPSRLTGIGHLRGAVLYSSCEPCPMCLGAALEARVGRIVFGAWEPRTGACGSLWDVVRDRRLVHRPEVHGGVLEDECAAVLEDFFRARR